MRAAAIILTLLVSMLTIQPVFAQHIDASLRIDPPEIAVRLFYSGTQIRVTGVSRVGKDLFLLCTGEEKTVELKEKKRIWNMLWINADEIAFKNVPSFYQLISSGKLSPSPMESDWVRAGIGFQALENRIVSGADEERQRRCFSELVKLKQREGLYSIQEGGLGIHPLGDEWNEFSGSFDFPSDASPGIYRFRLIGLLDGKAVDLASGQISVRLAGPAAFIRSLSMEHGLIYGIFSVVIALIAGLLTGIIFAHRSRKLRH